ncbi:MAG: CDP-archaeol synthase, partial [Thermodesulfobacteriota bacterium]
MPTLLEIAQALWFFVPAFLANMAPVLVQERLRPLERPLDFGATFRGRRVLGDHKTWRGLVAGVATAVAVFWLQRLLYRAGFAHGLARIDYGAASLLTGLALGTGALVGDAVKSFFKRQLDIAPGRSWLGFDQLDFLVGAWLATLPLGAPPFTHLVAIAPIVFLGA